MALIDLNKVEFGQTQKELALFDSLRTEGRSFKFTGVDGKEDCINGIFQLKHVSSIGMDTPYFGFDEFRAEDNVHPNKKSVSTYIVKSRWGRLVFKPNKKKIGIGFLPDTRRNRGKLADMLSEKKFIIEGLLTAEGSIDAVTVRKEIEMLAIKRKADRIKEQNTPSAVERMYKNMSADQRDSLIKMAVEDANKAKEKISLESVVGPKPESAPSVATKAQDSATTLTMVIPDAARPEGKVPFFALNAKAVDFVAEANSEYVAKIKQEMGEKRWKKDPLFESAVKALIAKWK